LTNNDYEDIATNSQPDSIPDYKQEALL